MIKCFSLFQTHRVVLPKDTAARRRPRWSIINFVIPRIDEVITPIGDQKKYKPFTAIDSIETHKATYLLAQI